MSGNPYGTPTQPGSSLPGNSLSPQQPPSASPYGSQSPYGAQPTATTPVGTQPVGGPSPYGTQPSPYGNPAATNGLNNSGNFANPNNPVGQPTQPGFASNPAAPLPTTATLRDGRTIKVRPYKVKAGDTLFDIARYELGKASRWSEIFQINQPRLGDGLDYLAPGMDLLLPDTGAPAGNGAQPGGRVTTNPGDRPPLSTSRDFAPPR